MGLCWGLRVDLLGCRRDQMHLYGLPGRKRGADKESGPTTDLGNFVILLRILSRHVGPDFSTCGNMCPWDEPSLPKRAH